MNNRLGVSQFAGLLPFLIALAVLFVAFARSPQAGISKVAVVSSLCVLVVLLFAPYFMIFRKRTAHGVLHLLLSMALLSTLLVVSTRMNEAGEQVWVELAVKGLLLGSSGLLLSLAVAVPGIFLPAFQEFHDSTKEKVGNIDLFKQEISERVKSISDSAVVLERKAAEGAKVLEETLGEIQSSIEAQALVLDKLERENERARTELAFYEELNRMTKEELSSFLDLLARYKQGDYWVGLGTGIVSSAVVAATVWLLSKLGP